MNKWASRYHRALSRTRKALDSAGFESCFSSKDEKYCVETGECGDGSGDAAFLSNAKLRASVAEYEQSISSEAIARANARIDGT